MKAVDLKVTKQQLEAARNHCHDDAETGDCLNDALLKVFPSLTVEVVDQD